MRPTLPAWLADEPPRGGAAPPPGGEPPPPPDARAREASRVAGRKIARVFAASAEELAEEAPRGPVPKPYTVPPGWKAPTMGEQFRYAAMKHPYARYGYVGAVLLGLLGWAIATEERKHEERKHPSGKQQ